MIKNDGIPPTPQDITLTSRRGETVTLDYGGSASANTAISILLGNRDIAEPDQVKLMQDAILLFDKLPPDRKRAVTAMILDEERQVPPSEFDQRVTLGSLRAALKLFEQEEAQREKRVLQDQDRREKRLLRWGAAIGFGITAALQAAELILGK